MNLQQCQYYANRALQSGQGPPGAGYKVKDANAAGHPPGDRPTLGSLDVKQYCTLQAKELSEVRKANEALRRRRRAQKSRSQNRGTLATEDTIALINQKDTDGQLEQEAQSIRGRRPCTEVRARRCGNCGATGHNTRTCNANVKTFIKRIPNRFIN